ncbi:hypothetical protein GTQ43_33880 [Nostoc sp. KVJ3]|uniref:NACHT C-terminal helical domain 2-containing protein n=1 Tax=Nostoc sp. KVJ3 TaxID=457945 RepID=UPI0022372355|nr:hypothetical protein [Nostoc sp. KVJ3]MCW5318523.1 hypothetical protein [Nostoc sp. KVJ3]
MINYHSRGRTHTHDLEGLNYEQAYNLGFYENFQEDLFNELEQELNLDLIDGLDNNLALDCKNLFNRTAMNAFNHTQAEKLDQLEQALSTPRIADLEFPQWQTYGNQWVKELRQLIIKHCDIGHDWQFSYAQKKQLQHYYDVNKFLVDLINIQGAVSDTTCIEIENTLLLPWKNFNGVLIYSCNLFNWG